MRLYGLLELPPEIWVLVFTYLSVEEKHTVRRCCKYFRRLIDHSSLWKDYTVVQTNLPRYTRSFWKMLNNRRLTRVAVRHLRPKDWESLVKFLPSVTTLVCMKGRREYKTKYLDHLSKFPNLKGLGVRNATWDEAMLGQSVLEHLQERLTHLSVCNVQLPNTAEFINSVSRMVNLQYLLFHQQGEGNGLGTVRQVPCDVFHNLLLNLKRLKHLSWGMKGEPSTPLPDDYFCPPNPDRPGVYGGPALTNLELVNYPETVLSENALRGLTSLESLSVHYNYLSYGVTCRLRSWLSQLPRLKSLVIIGGNSLTAYTSAVPTNVTRLTLRVVISLTELDLLSTKLKGLEHLDMDQNRFSGSLCKRLPTQFPKLKTLRIRFYRHEPDRDLLCLNELKHLERLDLVIERSYILKDDRNGHSWPSPSLQGLIRELRELSGNRISIVTTMRRRKLFHECDCVWEGE